MTTRLLTLTGAGGAGKSRLAFQVAAEAVEHFADGVWVTELASLADPALVPQAVVSTLKVSEQSGRSLSDTLADYLRHKSLLLVLDNCEHLQSACAQLATALLRECPTLRILATSRVPLSAPGEMLWRIPSLSLPDTRRPRFIDNIESCEAVRLFVERALSVDTRFALTSDNASAVAEACKQLDGIPLAIELAAARTRVLAVEQIAARLHDRFRLLTVGSPSALPRHQTLRATMDWSYGLLAESERVLLRRLSVFAGGWTLEAAEAICSEDGVERAEVLNLLGRLVDSSLIVVEPQRNETRYRLLETVRQYSHEKLHKAGETTRLRRRHWDWYVELAERGDASLRGPEEDAWFTRLEVEHDNLRAAIEWSKAQEDGATGELRLARALDWFWFWRGHWSEGRGHLEGAIARAKDVPPSYLPKGLVGTVRLAFMQGDLRRATVLCQQGLTLCRQIGDKSGTAQFLIWSAILATREARYEEATALAEEALALCRQIGDGWWAAEALGILCAQASLRGDYERASAFSDEHLTTARATGSPYALTYALLHGGRLAVRRGDWQQAIAHLTECLSLRKGASSPVAIAWCLESIAWAQSVRAAHEQAAVLFGAVDTLQQLIGGRVPQADPSEHDRYVACVRTELGEATFAAARDKGRAMTPEQAVEYALASTEAAPRKVRSAADLLTAREREVAALVARGLTNRQIAAKLVVTERTAETHVQNILNKLGFTSRAQIAAWAVEQGLRVPT